MFNEVEYNVCIFGQHMYGRYLKGDPVSLVTYPQIRTGKFLDL